MDSTIHSPHGPLVVIWCKRRNEMEKAEIENSHIWSIVLIEIWELPKRTHDCRKDMERLYTLPPTLHHTLSHYQRSTQIVQTPSPTSKSTSTSTSFFNKPKLHFYCP